MISTLLVENASLVRGLFWVGVLGSAGLGWMLYRHNKRGSIFALAIVGLLGVIALTLSPSDSFGSTFCTVQFSIPFQGIDTLANIAMVLPLALFASLWAQRPLSVFAAVVTLSVLVELIQATIPALGRACDTNDWLMNTVGAALGALLAVAIIALPARRGGHADR